MIDLRDEFDLTTVRFGDLANNGQPQTTSSLFASFARITSPEPLKHPFLISRIDSRALILDR